MARFGEGMDWPLIGRNVRLGRIVRGYSQGELARRAGLGVSTIYHVERGVSISRRSLLKISASLDEALDIVRSWRGDILTPDRACVVYRRATAFWTADFDTRATIPPGDLDRIQDPQERVRLGRLGLVPVFFSSTSFLMPEGPGVLFIELYRRITDALNPSVYRDCQLICVQGRAQVRIRGETVRLGEGDHVGYRSREMEWFEPEEGSDLPVRLTWVGAVRFGSAPRNVDGQDSALRESLTR